MIQENLLYSIAESNDYATLFHVHDAYLTAKYVPYFQFCKDYYGTHGKVPGVFTVEQKFGISLTANANPAKYWLEELILKYKEGIVEQAIIASAKDKKRAIEIMQEAIVLHASDHELRVLGYDANAQDRTNKYLETKANGGISYLRTGQPDFDAVSMGYKRADLWTIAGREGLGKTWLLLRLADWLDQLLYQIKMDRNILIVSCEMDNEELTERLDCIRAHLSYNAFIQGGLTESEELRYARYLRDLESHIKIVDDCATFQDVENYMTVYNPAAVFLDGSHQLSPSYDWKDVAALTARMKRATRLKRIPIINTTHLKSGKGTSTKGGDLDDMAYSKGYTRDSDIVGIMYADDQMEMQNQVGIDWVKKRRGVRSKLIYQNDYTTMELKVVETLTGAAALGGGGAVDENQLF
jgi:replicative DNA helicase